VPAPQAFAKAAVDILSQTIAGSKILAKVNEEKRQPKCFVNLAGNGVENCGAYRIEYLRIRVAPGGAAISGSDSSNELIPPQTLDHLFDKCLTGAWLRNSRQSLNCSFVIN
jgi:hypothetical protein